MLRHLKPVANICMHFARHGHALTLTDLPEALSAVLSAHPLRDGRNLIISCEGLSGHLPGWPSVKTYAAAPHTISWLSGWLSDQFPQAEQRLILSQRAPDTWLFSAWRHHLLGQRMQLDWSDFAARFRPAADLAQANKDIADATGLTTKTLHMEHAVTNPLGIGGAFIQMTGAPAKLRARLTPIAPANKGASAALAAAFLRLNRTNLTDDDLRAQKRALAEAAGVGGWARAQQPTKDRLP
ncbi:MAG: hypothetical protein JKX69_13065 [Rhodobacteraceae bacterium]|nr:hypothetical protein [Paracoccaceae bacterium]PCJ86815.1 MAG: hypothetical protein COA52_14605 [Hyphomicrobiales bacterium]